MDNTVFIVDDDASIRDALAILLGLRGYRVSLFADAAGFLGACRPDWRGCALIDIRMPGMDGLSLQRTLREMGIRLPVIVITGHGDVRSARDAFKLEAVDFLEKPIDQARLIQAIDEAFALQDNEFDRRVHAEAFAARLDKLTPREREVMSLVVAGRHNREIAAMLGISPRTVEVHKARMLSKLEVESIPQLIRLYLSLDDTA